MNFSIFQESMHLSQLHLKKDPEIQNSKHTFTLSNSIMFKATDA